ncbi:RNA polymerase sigma-70 factor [Sediminicola luteus]|uniref:RNA polymerase sigma-70 factor n=1 Tax=Sediminicola luteus TaxID=319238 RepID=A0A2A4GDI3_9FLAO|nr:RNA polymerase sigma-70 factor [Sediminicola luteus]PCE66044.1 hypothetical protein B7P33_01720 [Sediminicola luteus]
METKTTTILAHPKAFEAVYKAHASEMLRYAQNVVGDKELARDMVQNVFTELWVRRDQITLANPRAYLFQAVKYQLFAHLRKKGPSLQDLARLEILDRSLSAHAQMEMAELQREIKSQIAKLPPKCRQAFELSRFDDQTHKEIAEKMGVSLQTVKNHITHALGVLRENLQENIVWPILLLFWGL